MEIRKNHVLGRKMKCNQPHPTKSEIRMEKGTRSAETVVLDFHPLNNNENQPTKPFFSSPTTLLILVNGSIIHSAGQFINLRVIFDPSLKALPPTSLLALPSNYTQIHLCQPPAPKKGLDYEIAINLGPPPSWTPPPLSILQ